MDKLSMPLKNIGEFTSPNQVSSILDNRHRATSISKPPKKDRRIRLA